MRILNTVIAIELLIAIVLLSYSICCPQLKGVAWLLPSDAACMDVYELEGLVKSGKYELILAE